METIIKKTIRKNLGKNMLDSSDILLHTCFMASEPKTLQQAVVYFSDPDNCLNYLVAHRPEWKNGVVCPTCGSKDVGFIASRRMWQCKNRHPKAQFSVKVGTIMEDSALALDKWLVAIWMQVNCRNGVSSWELHRTLGITQKCAWHMVHRIRLAMRKEGTDPFAGEVEADESFIGGKSKNMHMLKRIGKQVRGEMGRGVTGKAIVMGILDRNTKQVRAAVIPERKSEHLHGHIQKNVEPGSTIYTDELVHYENLPGYVREFINHTESYVRGSVHTNGLENFWSLLKRGINGTYVSIEPFHLQAYVDEQAFRYNNRKDMDDAGRFSVAVSQIVGKRLTYAELTDKAGETPEPF
jgi:transposase-like protein